MTRTDLILIGPDFINAPPLLPLDKRVRLLSTQAALASHRLTANPQYNTHIFLGPECVLSSHIAAPVMLSAIVVLGVSRMACVGGTRK